MAFRFKDLVVMVGGEGCGPASRCGPVSACGCCSTQCADDEYGCSNCASEKKLREQLRETLAQSKPAEEVKTYSKPQTLAEAEDLEQKLEGALTELRLYKETLRPGQP